MAQAQDVNFNQRVTDLYITITGADRLYTPQFLYGRSEFYTDWEAYAHRFYEFYPNGDINCCVAFSVKSSNTQVFYTPIQDIDLIQTLFHEHLHTDILVLNPIDSTRSAWGFQIVYGNWERTELTGFDELFVDVLATLMMREAGFPHYQSPRYLDRSPHMEMLLSDAMDTHNLTLADLWLMHTESRLLEFLTLIGDGDMDAGYTLAISLAGLS